MAKAANKKWYVAALLSLLFPGLGQVYAGRWKRGVILFMVAVVAAIAAFRVRQLLFLSGIVSLFSIVDAAGLVTRQRASAKGTSLTPLQWIGIGIIFFSLFASVVIGGSVIPDCKALDGPGTYSSSQGVCEIGHAVPFLRSLQANPPGFLEDIGGAAAMLALLYTGYVAFKSGTTVKRGGFTKNSFSQEELIRPTKASNRSFTIFIAVMLFFFVLGVSFIIFANTTLH